MEIKEAVEILKGTGKSGKGNFESVKEASGLLLDLATRYLAIENIQGMPEAISIHDCSCGPEIGEGCGCSVKAFNTARSKMLMAFVKGLMTVEEIADALYDNFKKEIEKVTEPAKDKPNSLSSMTIGRANFIDQAQAIHTAQQAKLERKT